jgi:hypothetical protein
MVIQELAHFLLHALDFRQKSARRKAVRLRIGDGLSQMYNLGPKVSDSIHCNLQFLIVCDHGYTSAMPRRVWSRLS